jgi:hypothetical protein
MHLKVFLFLIPIALSAGKYRPRTYDEHLKQSDSTAYFEITTRVYLEGGRPSEDSAFRCYAFRAGIVSKLNSFSVDIKRQRASYGAFKAIWFLFVNENLIPERIKQVDLKYEYLMFMISNKIQESSDPPKGKRIFWSAPESTSREEDDFADTDERTDVENDLASEIAKYRIILKSPFSKPESEENQSLVSRVSRTFVPDHRTNDSFLAHIDALRNYPIDHYKVGKMIGKMLIWKDYACMDEVELSLVVFKLLYFQIIPYGEVDNFLSGLIAYLQETSRETIDSTPTGQAQYAQETLKKFYGFNLMVLLGTDSELANDLYDFILDTDVADGRVSIKKNFVELYLMILKTVGLAEDYSDTKHTKFLTAVLHLEKKALKHLVASGTFLAIFLALEALHGLTTSPLEKHIGDFIGSQTIFLVHMITDALSEYFPSLEKNDQENMKKLADKINSQAKGFDFSTLGNFLEHFEGVFENHKNCVVCRSRGKYHDRHLAQIPNQMI